MRPNYWPESAIFGHLGALKIQIVFWRSAKINVISCFKSLLFHKIKVTQWDSSYISVSQFGWMLGKFVDLSDLPIPPRNASLDFPQSEKRKCVQKWVQNKASVINIWPIQPAIEGENDIITTCFFTGPLSDCIQRIDPATYFSTCIYDLCQLLPEVLFLCGSVETYIYNCGKETNWEAEIGDWRAVATECRKFRA